MERNNNMNIATYQATPEKHGDGTFFFTDCGHNMCSVRDDMVYLYVQLVSVKEYRQSYISEVLKSRMSIGTIN